MLHPHNKQFQIAFYLSEQVIIFFTSDFIFNSTHILLKLKEYIPNTQAPLISEITLQSQK